MYQYMDDEFYKRERERKREGGGEGGREGGRERGREGGRGNLKGQRRQTVGKMFMYIPRTCNVHTILTWKPNDRKVLFHPLLPELAFDADHHILTAVHTYMDGIVGVTMHTMYMYLCYNI